MGGLSGPLDLPPDVDRPDAEIQYDDDDDNDIQAVESESDNYLIEQSEAACGQVGGQHDIKHDYVDVNVFSLKDRKDYCDKERRSDYLGPDHTMCKFCVSDRDEKVCRQVTEFM